MLKRFLYPLIALLFILFVFTISALLFPIATLIWLVTVLFDPNLRALHMFTCFWASLFIWVFPPWNVTVTGRENVDPQGTYVIVSNHQSLVDILTAFTLFVHFKWVSKSELFNIPLIGWNMHLNQYVRLERGRKNSIRKMYKACEDHLKQGSSVYLFPEGTRSETGKLKPFKEGAFVLAKRMNLPILPIVINGSKNAVPKNSFNFHGRSDVTLEILPPVLADPDLPAAELADLVRELIRSRVKEEQV
jgi:1-acyl-sn-glycerol-3-phosphate acyltransferase